MSYQPPAEDKSRLIDIGGARLFMVERGRPDAYPIVVLHGGPGFDHHEFGHYLDPLTGRGYRLLLVDQRGQGRSDRPSPSTWTLEKMAEDVLSLARSLALDRYAVLGHSFGAFVALQNAVDFPGMASETIVSGGVPSSMYLDVVERNLAEFQPIELREQVARSWKLEATVTTQPEMERLWIDQSPFHFADPQDPRIGDYNQRTSRATGAVYSPAMLRHFSRQDYGGIEVEDRLGEITQPVLVLAGLHDRVCSVEAAEAMTKGIPRAELIVFERSGHMTFVEENELYIEAVDAFLRNQGARPAPW
jgi:proline-specific peptidase